MFFRFLNDPQLHLAPVANYFIARYSLLQYFAANTALSQIMPLADLKANQRMPVHLTVAIKLRALRADHHVKPQQHLAQERLFQDQQLAH